MQYIRVLNWHVTLGGNPAGVCLLAKDIPDSTKQKIATELNHPVTAFLLPKESSSSSSDVFSTCKRFQIRWFTPTVEDPLCGHATIASASVLFARRNNAEVLCSSIAQILCLACEFQSTA
jgi:PhzF family phenazine biosynthesis protein